MSAATGSVIAYATAPGSVAADGAGRNGVYTKHLLASLAQPNTDILKVFQRTRAEVVKETGGKQTPGNRSRSSATSTSSPAPPAAPAAPARRGAGANPRGGRAGVVEQRQKQPRQTRS